MRSLTLTVLGLLVLSLTAPALARLVHAAAPALAGLLVLLVLASLALPPRRRR